MELVIDYNNDEIRFNNLKFPIQKVHATQVMIIELLNAIAESELHNPGDCINVTLIKEDEDTRTVLEIY